MCRTDRKDPDSRKRQWVSLRAILFLISPLCLTGCEHSPDYSIFGSFFPVWIFCSGAGLLLMAGARAIILRTSIANHLVAPVLLYFSIAVFFACALWLLFYR
jgi:hypothetical protein